MKHFVLESDSYVRNLDVLGTYRSDAIAYLHKMSGKPISECTEYVDKSMSAGGRFEVKDPATLVLDKNEHGDRYAREMPFSKYISDVVKSGRIISPTMAVYKHPDEERSILSDFVVGNMAKRKTIKLAMFKAEREGNEELAVFKDIEQTSVKINNNSLSGAHSSPFTPLYLKSAHSSLTSTCRSATSYGNANNEKFLFGNRHYWSFDICTANIVRITQGTDYERLAACMEKYGIIPPTYDQTMECVSYSTDQYIQNPVELAKIATLVSKLDPMERAAFVYTGDMHHLAKYNDSVVRTFLDRLSERAKTPELSLEEADEWNGKLDGDQRALVSLLCAQYLNGEAIKDVRGKDEEGYRIIGSTAKRVIETLDFYFDMIQTLWVTEHVPASVAAIPTSIRKGAITSDTDSTIFTVQQWVEWFSGEVAFDEKSMGIWYSTVYIASSLIVDILARMCANMGVERKNLHRLIMKNEYSFPVFSLTSRSKHYYAYISAREGNVYRKKELEVKGVALRNSNLPPDIMKKAHKLITDSMDSIMEGKKISINEVLTHVADIERSIMKSVRDGEYVYLASAQVKTADSYKNPASSPYLHYEMWQEVFAPKYGECEPPAYSAVKVSVEAKNQTQVKAWLDGLEDQALALRMGAFLKSKGKTSVTSLILPEINCAANGVPKEVIAAVNLRKLVYGTMEPFYLILESLGIFMQNSNITRLASDTH